METVEKLDYQLPAWSRRPAWVSDAAHARWAPRLTRIQAMWARVEVLSVIRGIRRACITNFADSNLVQQSAEATEAGLIVHPIRRIASTDNFQAAMVPPVSGQPSLLRVGITHRSVSGRVFQGEDEEIGDVLGFPTCCRRAWVERWWNPERPLTSWLDPTAAMVAATGGTGDGPAVSNPLLRWLGVRLIPHIPCSFTCAESEAFGNRFLELAREVDPEAAEWCLEMLGWPLQWDSAAGILILTTPLFRLTAQTDVLKCRMVVSRTGPMPELAPTGLGPLFNKPTVKAITETKSYLSAFEHSPAANGFSSEEAENNAHGTLLELLTPLHVPYNDVTCVDLGCGDGQLLRRIVGLRKGWRGVGVETDASKITRALIADPAILYVNEDLRESFGWVRWMGSTPVVLIAANRLRECTPIQRRNLIGRCRSAAWVGLYSYNYNLHEVLTEVGLTAIPAVTADNRPNIAILCRGRDLQWIN
jgi:hypothetical protein